MEASGQEAKWEDKQQCQQRHPLPQEKDLGTLLLSLGGQLAGVPLRRTREGSCSNKSVPMLTHQKCSFEGEEGYRSWGISPQSIWNGSGRKKGRVANFQNVAISSHEDYATCSTILPFLLHTHRISHALACIECLFSNSVAPSCTTHQVTAAASWHMASHIFGMHISMTTRTCQEENHMGLVKQAA